MAVLRIQRFLFDMIGLGGGFGLAMMISIDQVAQNESELRDFISVNKRLLDHCYKYERAGKPALLPVEGYRARCTMDYDGLFIFEDTLARQGDLLD